MAGKKALGSWDVNDKRTKAGKQKQLQTNGVKMFDSTVSLASGLFKTGKKKNNRPKPSNSYSTVDDYEHEMLSEEEIQKRKEKDKKSLPYMIILGVISLILVIFLWLFIMSLF